MVVFSRVVLSDFTNTLASFFRLQKPADMASTQEFVDQAIANHKVTVFGKSHCPYCHTAKAALEFFPLKPGALFYTDIENRPDVDAVQDYLKKVTGGRSVPRVFIGGKFLGGGDDTEAARKNGSLEAKLKAVGAI